MGRMALWTVTMAGEALRGPATDGWGLRQRASTLGHCYSALGCFNWTLRLADLVLERDGCVW